MATVTGLTLVKRFTYRGDPNEEFSNTYHFKNAPPGDDPSWTVLMNDVVAAEKHCFPGDVFYSRAYGYDSDDDHAHHVFAHDFSQPGPPPAGTYPISGGVRCAGDQASCIVWAVDRLNSRGKRIYLRKYFHAAYMDANNHDDLDSNYSFALATFAVDPTGIQFIHGGIRSKKYADNVISSTVLPNITTRTLKRRGKRPVPKN
jgi:hypothetical protein